ncbi:hypothetical protein N0V84_010516 [Fusarium piperis]|uniref:Uncharacterized protein n=1 Tax=Fusarium piperis TaxID=1435070 RepID=A0A9W8W3Q7_9HYPO|nr:hypothetical protein N0V84_010516 [Fusarium piperis]
MVRRLSYLEDVLASKSQDGPDQTIQVASESAGTPVPPYLPRSPSPTETRASQTTRNDVKEDRRAPERESSGGGSKRRRLTDASQPPPGSTQSSQDDEPCTAWQSPISRQAQHFLKGELGRSQLNMTQERERLFQSVLALAERVDMPAEPTWADRFEFEDTVDFDAQCMYPAPEFLYVTLDGLGVNSITTRFYLQLGRHLSKLTLERMEYALIENTVHGQRRLEYIICVNFWAYLVLTSLESEDPSTLIAQHLGGSRDRYFNNAKCALKRMSILATPTLSMLQALLCGVSSSQMMRIDLRGANVGCPAKVMFFLDVGDFEKCWILNAAACQAFVAIGGQHLVDQTSDPASTQAREVRASLFNCFVFDKAFSINMDRPCSMPEMEIDIPTLALSCKDEAVYDICVVLLELGKAMDALMKERRRRCEGDGAAGKMKRLQAILDSLDSVKEKVDQASHSPCQSENFLRGEWMSMEFAYYSVRGSILSMIMVTENDADTLQLRLASARRALTALKSMQDNTWAHFTQSRAFASSLTWTTLLFPFSALFLVFSNVVITGDLGDLRLLKDVGDGFSVVATGSPTISKIEDFCKRLVKLCFEAINKPRQSSIAASAPSLAPQPISDRSSAVPGPRRLVQNASRVRDMGNTSARQPTSAADAAAIPRPQFPTNLDNMDFVFGMDSLGMLDGTAGPLLFENNEEERIWQLYETHFDAFASEL